MAAPTFVSAGTASSSTGNATPGLPSGWAEHDIFLLVCETANETVSAPSGWTAVGGSPQGTGTAGGASSTAMHVFWRRATSSESAPTVTDPGDHCIAQIFAIRGCVRSGDPWNASGGNVEASSVDPGTATAITSTSNDSLIFIAAGYHQNLSLLPPTRFAAFTNASLSSLTVRSDSTYSSGNGGGLGVATGILATAGSTGTTTVSWNQSSTPVAGFHAFVVLALTPYVELACDSGSYTISGTDCALTAARTLACDPGVYSISGTDVSLETVSEFELACDPGVYTTSGTDCGLLAARVLEAEPGWTLITGKNITFGEDAPLTAGNPAPFCECCLGDVCCGGRCAPGGDCENPWPSTVQVDITDESGQCPDVTVTLNWGGTDDNPAWSGTVWVDCTHACGEDVRVRLAILVTCDASTGSGWGIAVLQQMPDACLTSSPPDMTKVSCDPLYLETDVCQECEAPLVEPGCPPTLAYCFNYVVYEV